MQWQVLVRFFWTECQGRDAGTAGGNSEEDEGGGEEVQRRNGNDATDPAAVQAGYTTAGE